MERLGKKYQGSTFDHSLIHTLSFTRAKLVPVYRDREHLTVKPSFVIVFELATQLDLFSQNAQDVIVHRLVFVFVAVFSNTIAVLYTVTTVIKTIHASAQGIFFPLEIPWTCVKIC